MISLMKGTKVRVVDKNGTTTSLVPIESVGKRALVYDWYGNYVTAIVEEAAPEKRVLVRGVSGEATSFGENHHILARTYGTARYERIPVASFDVPVFVHLPQRKIKCDAALFDKLEADDANKRVYIKPAEAGEFLPLCEAIATAGIAVSRHKSELRIDIERNRPSCFASKLIMGNFDDDLEGTLDDLCASTIINPHGPFNSEFLIRTASTEIIFEGSSLLNDVMVLPARVTEKKVEVFHVHTEAPLELTWFCT